MPIEPRKLADFEGQWRLHRDIVQADGTRARFSGAATWRPDGTGLIYSETGQMRVGDGAPMTATRQYRWAEDMSVYFDDGRFFHTVPLTGGPTAHWCDPDQYDGTYDFDDWPKFSVTWNVVGPRKSYRMVSRYTRG